MAFLTISHFIWTQMDLVFEERKQNYDALIDEPFNFSKDDAEYLSDMFGIQQT